MSQEHAYFSSSTPLSPKDAKKLKTGLSRIPGILSVSVTQKRNGLAVDYDDTGVSRDRLEKLLTVQNLGFSPADDSSHF